MDNEPKKFIDFIITQKCTYQCKYCSQSKLQTKTKNNADKKTIASFINFLKKIENDWEITITGGEAILHPDFFNIISNIQKLGFKLNLITNFSFDLEIYKKIFDILDEKLNRYNISFHLDEIKNFNETIHKLEKFIKLKPKNTKICFLIPIYKINKEKEEKIKIITEIAKKYDINYDFQQIRLLNKYTKISPREKKYLKDKKNFKSFSKLCNAGKTSLVIYENGEVYRCYSSRFLKSNSMGNINDKQFKLLKKSKPCTQKFCTCPKPIAYNQIQTEKNLKKALGLKIINFVFLPYYIIKNKKIIKDKLLQYFMQNR